MSSTDATYCYERARFALVCARSEDDPVMRVTWLVSADTWRSIARIRRLVKGIG